MLQLEGYKTQKKLSESREYVVFKAVRARDKLQVVLKSIRSTHPTVEQIALLCHEYAVSKDLSLNRVLKVYDLVEQDNKYTLVKEDLNGISLAEFLDHKPITDVSLFFRLATQMVKSIGQLHQHHMIHKDIKPSNFIINPQSLIIKLTDLNFATQLQQEIQDVVPPGRLEGTLAYMAPEQTGRMNCNIDYRADFYALGVSFYEMLTGQLPFQFKDPLELLSAHLTTPVSNINLMNPQIPEMLDKLVRRLMEKNPSERYQSILGIEADLSQCETEYRDTKNIKIFELGKLDVCDRLNLSPKLYGREKEIETLLQTYSSVLKGGVQSIMVSGYSGIGKTMLISEVHRPMVKNNGYFIHGKFDLLQRDTPYTAVTQAFNHLANHILAEPESRFNIIKSDILNAVGNIGQVVIDLAPNFEKVLGKQKPLEPTTPENSLKRLQMYFMYFLRAVAKHQPLVIFIDDLQWVDSGSLQLIETILTDEKLDNVLFVGAYRENEVDSQHPLRGLFKRLENRLKPTKTLKLKPLNADHYTDLLSDSFKLPHDEIRNLAILIHKRTDGNPFFCKQLANTLYQDKHLYFDHKQKKWSWNFEKIQGLSITENVIDLMLDKLKRLPQDTQEMLKFAACIGSRFNIEQLSMISDKSPDAIGRVLWSAMQQDLLITLRLSYKQVDALKYGDLSETLSKNIIYKFIHDKVQQSVYQNISQEERKNIHLNIANHLIRGASKSSIDARLFEIVDHFNQSLELLNRKEKVRVATLNFRAGIKAKGANAYQAMHNYLKAGIELSDDDWWEKHYQLRFDLELEYIESLYYLRQTDLIQAKVDALYTKCQNTVDELRIDRTVILQLIAEGELQKTWDTLCRSYGRIGYYLPKKPTNVYVFKLFLRIEWLMRKYEISKIDQQIPFTRDPSVLLVQEIVAVCAISVYLLGVNYYTSTALLPIRVSLERGLDKSFALALAQYAGFKIVLTRNFKQALIMIKKMEDFSSQHSNKLNQIRILGSKAYNFIHWFAHGKKAIEACDQALLLAKETGNLNEGILIYNIKSAVSLLSAKTFHDVHDSFHEAVQFSKAQKINNIIEVVLLAYKCIEAMFDNKILSPREFDERYNRFIEQNSITSLVIADTLLVYYYYFLEQYDYGCECFERSFKLNYITRAGSFAYVSKTLVALMLPKQVDLRLLKNIFYKRRFRWLKKELKICADASPVNFLHLYKMISGMEARYQNKTILALNFFNEAIANAKAGGFDLWTALASELAGETLLDVDQPMSAKNYIKEAYYYYKKFGMVPKVKTFEKRYSELLIEQAEVVETEKSSTSLSTTSAGLDFMSVIKASQTIAGEIVLTNLFEKMLTIMIENAGAERAVFVEYQHTGWFIIAEKIRSKGVDRFSEVHLPLEETLDLSKNIVQYAIRAKEPVVIKDALNNPSFSKDEYVLTHKPKSILCVPIIHHELLVGILYLENNLTTDAFTNERVTLLRALSGQVAISLENSRYIDKMKKLFEKAEKFVPKQFLELLHRKNIEEVELGDSEQREITVLFNDIRSFTTIVENRTPAEAFDLINRYWKFMAPVIRRHNGYIDHYQGDAILAIFSANPSDAVLAAIEMMEKLKSFNQMQVEIGDIEIGMGIGISTGSSMLGVIGEDKRHVSGLISDAANTAARIEGLNKFYRTRILFGDETYRRLNTEEAFHTRQIDRVRLVGKKQVTNVYEVIEWESQLQNISLSEYLALFDEAFSLYQGGEFEKGLETFNKCLGYYPDDGVVKILLLRIKDLTETVPPGKWDGIFILKYK